MPPEYDIWDMVMIDNESPTRITGVRYRQDETRDKYTYEVVRNGTDYVSVDGDRIELVLPGNEDCVDRYLGKIVTFRYEPITGWYGLSSEDTMENYDGKQARVVGISLRPTPDMDAKQELHFALYFLHEDEEYSGDYDFKEKDFEPIAVEPGAEGLGALTF